MLCEACGWLTISHSWHLKKEIIPCNENQKRTISNLSCFLCQEIPLQMTKTKFWCKSDEIGPPLSIFKARHGTYSSQSPSYQHKTLRYGNNVFTRWIKAATYVFAAILIFTELYHILAHALHSSNLVHYSLKTREVSYTRSVFVLLLIGWGKKNGARFLS